MTTRRNKSGNGGDGTGPVRKFPATRITENDLLNLQVLHDQIEVRQGMKQRLADKLLDLLSANPKVEKDGYYSVEREVSVIGRITEERLLIGSKVYYVRLTGSANDLVPRRT
jgi:hypothetical protein